MITLLVMTDGRADCLARSMATYRRLHGPITQRVIHDDSGDPAYRAHLTETHHGWTVVSTGQRSGFAGAYRNAWAWLRAHCTSEFVFSTEDDFEIAADIDLDDVAQVLRHTPHLAQMALLRQAVNPQEQAAGGIVQTAPWDYTDRSTDGHHWLAHRKFYTTNPHLTRRAFIDGHDWPDGPNSEGRFGLHLFAGSPRTECGFWGRRTDPPRVHHIGTHRIGTGY